MKQKRYHVIVSGTEFFLDVEQTGGSSDVPYIGRQENRHMWTQACKDRMVKNPRHK